VKPASLLWTLFLAASLSGCDLIVGELPPADPIWTAAIGPNGMNSFEPAKLQTGQTAMTIIGAADAQRMASERVRFFLAKSLPMSFEDFMAFARRSGLTCERNECHYSKARSPQPCTSSLRVSIEMLVGAEANRMVSASSIDVQALITRDDEPDNRGCFPL
jgi:hypothetical protein